MQRYIRGGIAGIAALGFLLLVVFPSAAFISPLCIEELVQTSDVVIVGDVKENELNWIETDLGIQPEPLTTVSTGLQVTQTLSLVDLTGQIVVSIPSDWFVSRNHNASYWQFVTIWNKDNSSLDNYSSMTGSVSKPELTEAQKKLSTDLLQLSDIRFLNAGITRDDLVHQMNLNHQLMWVDDTGTMSNKETCTPVVYVYIKTFENADSDSLLPFIVEVTDTDPSNHLIVAWVNVDNLTLLASLDAVRSIQTVIPPITQTGTC